MSRVTDVLLKARRILGDTAGDRWSDAILLDLYNQCLVDMTLQTNALHSKAFIEIEANINTYVMPDDVLRINRVQYLDTKIPVFSHEEMDKRDSLWETRKGSVVEAVITNLTNAGTFKIYPRIIDATMDYVASNSNYGIIVDITIFDNIYNLPNIAEVDDIPKYLVVYYTKIPDTVTLATEDTDLEFSRAWDNALHHFIAGFALRDDEDQQNRAFGAEELQIYANNVTNIIQREMKNFTLDTNSTGGYIGFPI